MLVLKQCLSYHVHLLFLSRFLCQSCFFFLVYSLSSPWENNLLLLFIFISAEYFLSWESPLALPLCKDCPSLSPMLFISKCEGITSILPHRKGNLFESFHCICIIFKVEFLKHRQVAINSVPVLEPRAI